MINKTNAITYFEIGRLVILSFIPITVGLIGYYLNRRLKSFEHIQWTNQKLIDKKLEVYDDLVPKLNDILCYFTFIGSWKNIEPSKIIELKREVDKIAYVYAPLFPKDFLIKYNSFINLCYSSYSGWGTDAKLRTNFKKRKEANKEWKDSWNELFVTKSEDIKVEEVKEAYINFVQYFSKEINIGMNIDSINSGEIPNSMKSEK